MLKFCMKNKKLKAKNGIKKLILINSWIQNKGSWNIQLLMSRILANKPLIWLNVVN